MSSALVERRATLIRLGARSGKIIVIVSSIASGASRMVTRDTSRLTTTASASDAARAGQGARWASSTGDRPTARDIQRDYLDGASYGVQVFTPGRIGDAERMAKAIARDPQGYRRAIDLCLPRAKASEARLRAIYLGLHGLFPDQALPHIYLVFGAGNSGGTAGPGAQVIGIETLCKISADGAAFDAFLRHFYAHETVHTLQREEATDGAKAPLLAQILTEGGADFVARLVTGDEPDPKRAEWAAAHTGMLMRQLRDDLAATRGADLEKLTETSPGVWQLWLNRVTYPGWYVGLIRRGLELAGAHDIDLKVLHHEGPGLGLTLEVRWR